VMLLNSPNWIQKTHQVKNVCARILSVSVNSSYIHLPDY
jgi:hypothetical protein